MVCGDCQFILQVEIVVFEPVCYCLTCVGDSTGLREGSLPPWVMCIQISHEYAVGWEFDSWKNGSQWLWPTGGVEIEEGELFVSYIDRPMRPAEACLDRCRQMPIRKVLSGTGGQWPPVTSRLGGGKLPPKDLEAGDW